MTTKREIISVTLSILLFALLLSFNNNLLSYEKIPIYLLVSLIIILVSVFAKKITSRKIDVKIEHRTWEWSRYWFGKGSHLPWPIPVGFFLPALLAFLTYGGAKVLTFLQFESEALPSKASKKYGVRRFSTVIEWDDALIGFYGLVAVLVLALIAKLMISLGFFPFYELAKFSVYYSIYNIIPFSKLDGMKIFMGSRPLYIFSLVLIAATAAVIFL